MNLKKIAELRYKPDYQNPRDDYYVYFHDMQQFIGGYLNFDALRQNPGASFLALIEKLIGDSPACLMQLQRADLIIFTHFAYEYDVEYSHVGSMLAQKYDLNAELLDVIVDETALDVASHVASAYLSQGVKSTIVIIMLEQTAMPLRVNEQVELPTENSVCFFVVGE
jgi:hypothetical protein